MILLCYHLLCMVKECYRIIVYANEKWHSPTVKPSCTSDFPSMMSTIFHLIMNLLYNRYTKQGQYSCLGFLTVRHLLKLIFLHTMYFGVPKMTRKNANQQCTMRTSKPVLDSLTWNMKLLKICNYWWIYMVPGKQCIDKRNPLTWYAWGWNVLCIN